MSYFAIASTYKCVDKRVGELINTLKKRGQYDNSIIIALGDHGQELYEYGQLIHTVEFCNGNNPYLCKIDIPLYYKFLAQDNEQIKSSNNVIITSHVDVFPTLFEYLGIENLNEQLITGQSILSNPPSSVVSITPNGRCHPWRFAIITENEHKLTAQFNHTNIFKANRINIISLSDIYDNEISNLSKTNMLSQINYKFNPHFSQNLAKDRRNVCQDLFSHVPETLLEIRLWDCKDKD